MHSWILTVSFTWCIDAQYLLVPAGRLHSHCLILTTELNLSVAASRIIFQENEHFRGALPRIQQSELQCNQCCGCFMGERNGLLLARWVSHPAWNSGRNHHNVGSDTVGCSRLHLFCVLIWSWWFTCQRVDICCWSRRAYKGRDIDHQTWFSICVSDSYYKKHLCFFLLCWKYNTDIHPDLVNFAGSKIS